MSANAYAADTKIFVTWTGTGPAAVRRRVKGEAEWTVLSSAAGGGRFIDDTAVPGTVYEYQAVHGGITEDAGEAWIQPLWGWNTVTQVWTANDILNRPTFRARIVDAVRRLPLPARLVRSAKCEIFAVLDNDVTDLPRYDLVADAALDPADVLLPNLIADRVWCDSTGFNFRHTPDLDLEPGRYAVRYTLDTGAEPVLVSFLYDNSQRRTLNG